MSTINIPDFAGTPTPVQLPNTNGQALMAASRPVVIASDQSALPITDNAGSLTVDAPATTPVFVRLSNGSAAIDPLLFQQLPGTLGIKTAASSLSITHASDDALLAANGAVGDTAWTTGNGSHTALLKTIAGAALDTTTPSPVSVQTPADVLSFTPTLDTAAYASGDVLFATVTLGTVTRVNDGRAVLMSLTGIDKSKNKPAMTLLFYQTNVTSAALNAANNLSDADQANLLGYVRILAADWIDYANNSLVCKTSINLLLEAVSGAQNVYAVGILDAGTPTFAASDLVFKLGFVQS